MSGRCSHRFAVVAIIAAVVLVLHAGSAAAGARGTTFDDAMGAALGDMQIYFGNLHSHTSYSDGTGTPEQAFGWARDVAGFDFYAVTDHAEQVSPPAWDDTRGRSNQASVDGWFSGIAGFEWTSGAGHANVFNTSGYTDAGSSRSLESLYNWLAANGGWGQFNHPAFSAGTFNNFTMSGNPSAKRMALVETGNAGAGNNTGFFYNWFITALDKGWHVAPTSNQDNHSLGTNSHRTGVICQGLSRECIMEAISKRRVYSSDDPDLQLVFKCGADWMGSVLGRDHGNYTFDVLVRDNEDLDRIELVTNGGAVVASQVFSPSASVKQFEWHPTVEFSSSRSYYFVRVIERDTNDEDESHRGNQVALSAPIWLAFPQHDVSIKVQASGDIVAERPMYFSYRGAWAGGTTETGVAEPRMMWYLAEGTTWPGFEEWICIQNPGEEEAGVGITYMFPGGRTLPQVVAVPPHSRYTINVNAVVGPGQDVSAQIQATRPVVVERPMYFEYHDALPGGSISAAVPAPSVRWYFAEGATNPGFEQWISLMNPWADEAFVAVTYMFRDGSTQLQTLRLPPYSRDTIMVNNVVGPGRDVSACVEASLPIIAERPMYFSYYGRWAGGSTQFGATIPSGDWYFAEGTTRANRLDGYFDEWLCILNPGDEDALATVTYMFGSGSPQVEYRLVRAHSRSTIKVNEQVGPDRDVSVRVTADKGIVVERPTYYNYHSALAGGDVELGCNQARSTWHFAEGTNRDGFEEWLTLQNPNDHVVQATVTLMLEDGSTREYTYELPSSTRTTITINGLLAVSD